MNEEYNISDERVIDPTPEVIQYLLDCGDISLEEYTKYLEDPDYTPVLNPDHDK
tara:strand:- start:2841 stop:3002 length:162 start_codon:yes stop_codon:yes gene_type:complete